MIPRALLLPALLGLVQAQDATITSNAPVGAVATPDALPLEDLRNLDIPTYTETPGLASNVITYVAATATAAAAAEQKESPLSVFPAVTTVPINAAGEDSASSKRGLGKRAACDPQATIANYYNVNVDSHDAFKADPTVSSVALSAPTPSGYFNNFKNAPGANSAYAYMGYAIVNKGKTGYDTNWCAKQCDSIAGCLSFNIYFERDPTIEPGAGCKNPTAFANIKCSFWGTALDSTTANNYGQWRDDFQVGIAGSNAYTSYKVGGPIDKWSSPQKLDTATMNAPLWDCSNTWTYLGYKMFQSGPYDPNLCAAACDAQTAYNVAHPPSKGKPVKCAAFGTYILTMTNKTSSYQMGQMCTLYTSAWDSQYAVNKASYDDGIGAKYTYSYSFFYSKPDIQPVCTSDIKYLISSGSDFCTSFNGYSAPTVTATATQTPNAIVEIVTTTFSTSIAMDPNVKPTATITADVQWKRDEASPSDSAVLSNNATYATVANVGPSTAVTLASYVATLTAANGTVPTDAPDNVVAPAAKRHLLERAVATPASIASWPSARIAEACSSVATGTTTTTLTATLPASQTTSYVSLVAATTLQACVIPSQNPDYTVFNPVWGKWNGDTVGDLGYSVASREMTVQLPFAINIGKVSSNVLIIGTNGYVKIGDSSTVLSAFAGQGGGLYIYGGTNGVFYRITGPVGSRQLVVAWYVGTYNYGHMQQHFTITYFESTGTVQYKYYDIVQSGIYQAQAYVTIAGQKTDVNSGKPFNNGDQFQITTSGTSASVVRSTHNRVDCCTKRPDNWFGGWHSCTEYQPAKES